MNLVSKTLSAAALAAALALGGCNTDPAPAGGSPMMSNMPVMAGCPDKDGTHMVVADAPIFAGPPGQGAVPIGVLKSGSKVLAMVPGVEYTKCTIDAGKTVYIKTSMLKPTTN